jgi:hypothetical protein
MYFTTTFIVVANDTAEKYVAAFDGDTNLKT